MVNYKDLIETAIKRECKISGKAFSLRQAGKVEGLELDDEGSVLSIEGKGEDILSNVIKKYEEVTGPVAEAIIANAIKRKYGKVDLELPENIKDKI